MSTAHPDDIAVLSRWEQLGRPPIPVAFNEQGLVRKIVTDLTVFLSMLQDAEERRQAVDWVLKQRDDARGCHRPYRSM